MVGLFKSKSIQKEQPVITTSTDGASSSSTPSHENVNEMTVMQQGEDTEKNVSGLTVEDVIPDFDGKKWYQLAHIRSLCFTIFVISLTSCNNGYDGSLLNSLYTEDQFNNAIGNVSGAVLGSMSNGFAFGCLITFLITPYLVDTYGRRATLYIGDIIMIIGTILQACSGAWIHGLPSNYKKKDVFGMLLASRIILGIGSGVASVAAPSLISEISFPTHRQTVTTYYNSSWYLGAIVSAWVSFGCKNLQHHWDWRVPGIIQGFFPLLQLCLLPFFVPESPRFLVAKNKSMLAREILNKYHAGGYEGADELIDYEMTEIQLAIQQEKLASSSSYAEFYKTKANLRRLWIIVWLAIFMQLSGNGLVSYYLGKVLTSIGIKSTNEQLIVNGGLMIYNWGVCVIQSFLIVNRLKRRLTFNISVGGMLFCFTIWTILSAINQKRDFQDKSLGQGVLAMIFFYYFFYNFGLNGMPFTYVTEILPFTLRGKGMNIFTLVQYGVMLYNGFVNPIAMDAIEWKYYIVYCCILAVEFLVCFTTFVETSGRTLEEVAEVFGDGIQDLNNISGLAVMEEDKIKPNDETEFQEYV
ncbi:related to hexose transporter protein [Saccharomycodes ludwigii]|uniref:Related to hexose transporter protein n=1 Tax=Saccharomycodes ludwigii TaxID=36035 RepID=A0A376B9U9_9ASCO|nr:hypothetical protein SCDLUD_001414 [Saccharomycodes ludwigii]KAH3901647.1 hypothetical protein SCDLUD_001414 [Saccharomycodes ludwigii]SSD61349.1 related to hexose transporter protein [Saccharomycodes ludwigii]